MTIFDASSPFDRTKPSRKAGATSNKFPIVVTLVVCGALCIVASLGLSGFLIKQLAPMIGVEARVRKGRMLLVGITAVPCLLTFGIGVTPLVIGLRSALSKPES